MANVQTPRTPKLKAGLLVSNDVTECPAEASYAIKVRRDQSGLIHEHVIINPVSKRSKLSNGFRLKTDANKVTHTFLSPLPSNCSYDIDKLSYRIETQFNGDMDINYFKERPEPDMKLKTFRSGSNVLNLPFLCRRWFEMKSSCFFTKFNSNFLQVSEVLKRDHAFNELFGVDDIPRICQLPARWDSMSSEEKVQQSMNSKEYLIMLGGHPLEMNDKGLNLPSSVCWDTELIPLNPFWQFELEENCSTIDSIIEFVYDKSVGENGVVTPVTISSTDPSAPVHLIVKNKGKNCLGDVMSDVYFVDYFKQHFKLICPKQPNSSPSFDPKDEIFKDIPELFLHGPSLMKLLVDKYRTNKKRASSNSNRPGDISENVIMKRRCELCERLFANGMYDQLLPSLLETLDTKEKVLNTLSMFNQDGNVAFEELKNMEFEGNTVAFKERFMIVLQDELAAFARLPLRVTPNEPNQPPAPTQVNIALEAYNATMQYLQQNRAPYPPLSQASTPVAARCLT